jgi:hypothetical protein
MKTMAVRFSALALMSMALLIGPAQSAESAKAKSIDVALRNGGILIGQVVDSDGQSLPGTEIVLSSGGKEIGRCQTGKEGWFQVGGLKGGSIEVAAAGTTGNCRVWSPGTAPPAAQQGLLVVAESDVVRGQHMTGRAPRRGYGRGGNGGLLGLMIDHPLVTAGAVGAAIAVPLAVSNDESPSSP